MPDKFEQARKNIGLGDHYVIAYEDERRIYNCLFKFLFPKNTAETLKEFDDEFASLSEAEKLAFFEDESESPLNEIFDFDFDDFFPKTEEAKEAARKQFESLSADEKKEAVFRSAMFFSFFYAIFYNLLSLMVHGQKLTTLVPLAIQGDKDAFCKAAQIDRNLLTGHPFFKETFARLQTGEDKDFLDGRRKRQASSILFHLSREADYFTD